MLATIDAAILDVMNKIAAGNSITEYRLGTTLVKRSDPAQLLATLKDMRREYAAIEADRSAMTAANFGAMDGATGYPSAQNQTLVP